MVSEASQWHASTFNLFRARLLFLPLAVYPRRVDDDRPHVHGMGWRVRPAYHHFERASGGAAVKVGVGQEGGGGAGLLIYTNAPKPGRRWRRSPNAASLISPSPTLLHAFVLGPELLPSFPLVKPMHATTLSQAYGRD